MTLPAISIVTPSLNQGRFLSRTIQSVLSQRYPALEYLVVDGGSTDGTLDILHSYGDRVLWTSESDRGQAHAINKGLARSSGEIVGYLNSDDTLLPGALERIGRHFLAHPDCDVLYGEAFWIDEEDRVLGSYPTEPFCVERLLQNCFLCQPATFWRRSVMSRHGAFDETLHYALDYEYWLRLARAGVCFQRLHEPLACSRLHDATKTATGKLRSYEEVLQIGRRHAHQAGFSQYLAYWVHRIHERQTGWPRRLRHFASSPEWLAKLHYRWDQSNRRILPFLSRAVQSLTRFLPRSRVPRKLAG